MSIISATKLLTFKDVEMRLASALEEADDDLRVAIEKLQRELRAQIQQFEKAASPVSQDGRMPGEK